MRGGKSHLPHEKPPFLYSSNNTGYNKPILLCPIQNTEHDNLTAFQVQDSRLKAFYQIVFSNSISLQNIFLRISLLNVTQPIGIVKIWFSAPEYTT